MVTAAGRLISHHGRGLSLASCGRWLTRGDTINNWSSRMELRYKIRSERCCREFRNGVNQVALVTWTRQDGAGSPGYSHLPSKFL